MTLVTLDAVHVSQTQTPAGPDSFPARLASHTFSCTRFLVCPSFGVLSVEHFFRFPSGLVHSQEMVWYNLTGEPLPHHFYLH